VRVRACVRGARRNNGSAAERRTRHRRVSVDPAGAVKVNVLRSAAVSGERASERRAGPASWSDQHNERRAAAAAKVLAT